MITYIQLNDLLNKVDKSLDLAKVMKQDERPPKKWFNDMVAALRDNPDVDDPEALAGWIWHHQKK